MFLKFANAIVGTSLMIGAYVAVQGTGHAGPAEVGYVAVGSSTSVPYGWVEFCQRYRGECDGGKTVAQDVVLTAKSMREIERINNWVNTHVEPVSDMDHWGVVDRWDYPTDGKGDCEDYVLLKRRMLAEQGFPQQALLVTVVKDKNNDGHAVLTVKTDHGDFILDNLADDVKGWRQSGYKFVKRQSQNDQNVWVLLGEPTTPPLYVSK